MRSRWLITVSMIMLLGCTDGSDTTADAIEGLPFLSDSSTGDAPAIDPARDRQASTTTTAPVARVERPPDEGTGPTSATALSTTPTPPTTTPTSTAPTTTPTSTAPTTTNPPSTTAGPAGRPGGSPRLGISPGAGIVDLDATDLARDLDAMVELGLTSVRLDFDWSRIQPEPDRFEWSATDRVVAAAHARDVGVHGLITYTPGWARPPGSDVKHPPDDDADFAEFSRRVAQRYAPAGVISWEIWNEPNIAPFWSAADGPSSARYAELLVAAAGAIREVDPSAVVVTGGLAPADDRPGASIAPATYLESLMHAVPPGTVDAVALHPYSYPAMPSDDTASWNPFARLPEFSSLITAHHGTPLPIWITEFGAPTGSGSRSVTDQDQKAMVLDALACVAGADWLGPVFLYNLRDRPDGDPGEIEDHFGLLRADWVPKPVAEALVGLRAGTISLDPADPCTGW